LGFISLSSGYWLLSRISAGRNNLVAFGDREEERQMGVQDKSIEYITQRRMKWWYWFMLILGSIMIIGGIVYVIVL
jgi:hypothetical protein